MYGSVSMKEPGVENQNTEGENPEACGGNFDSGRWKSSTFFRGCVPSHYHC